MVVFAAQQTAGHARSKPHMLGGSNNLVSERQRREKAETALRASKQNLRAVAQDLAPQVRQLAQAVKVLQLEKRQQLELDEASQELLEALQEQINDVEAQQQRAPSILDGKLDETLQKIKQQFDAEQYELRTLIAQLQDKQQEQAVEIRLLQQELNAAKESLVTRLHVVEDSVESVRIDVARVSEQHHATIQTHANKVDTLDDKLFALDKELLKLKLALPASVAAQLPASFADQQASSTSSTAGYIEPTRGGGVGVTLKLQELATDLESVKADATAYRSADRKQFDAMTNRLREAVKCQQTLRKEMEARLHAMQSCCDQLVTKVPSELSKRLMKAQGLWDSELATLKDSVQQLQLDAKRQKPSEVSAGLMSHAISTNSDAMVKAQGAAQQQQQQQQQQRELLESVNGLEKELDEMRDKQAAHLARIDADLLGLYDWTRSKLGVAQR